MYGPEGAEAFVWAAWPLRTAEGCLETTLEPLESLSLPPVPQVRLYRESFSIDVTLEEQQIQNKGDVLNTTTWLSE